MIPILISLIAGTHIACYGAYKDSPYENFILRRAVREFILCGLSALTVYFFRPDLFSRGTYLLVFGLIVVASRILTECYKLFLRTENQTPYKIPSQVHILGSIPDKSILRIGLSLFFPLFLGTGVYATTILFSISNNVILRGSITGLIAGSITALGGAYKDGFFEGFSLRKFFRSPLVTCCFAALLAFKTNEPWLLFFSAMGYERMLVEFYKGFLKAGYVPGKFKAKQALFPQWKVRRKVFVLPYAYSWLFVCLLLYIDT